MGLFRTAALAAAACLVGCAPFPPHFPDPASVAESVYMVSIYDQGALMGTGTAWIYSLGREDTYLLTAGHICDKGLDPSYALTSWGGSVFQATSIYWSKDPDLCMLSVPGALGYEVPMADRMPEYDEAVFTVGAPGGFYGGGAAPIYHGHWSGAGTFTGAGIPGQSGSPVLSSWGVVGVLTQGSPSSGLAIVEPLKSIRAFLGTGKK